MTDDDSQDAFQADYCAERLKALGDPIRLRIVGLLRQGELAVGDISEFLEIPLAGASHHLQILKHARLVSTRREGRFIYYRLEESVLKSTRGARRELNLGCCSIRLAKGP